MGGSPKGQKRFGKLQNEFPSLVYFYPAVIVIMPKDAVKPSNQTFDIFRDS
jgi:hypothetical protein